MSETVWIVMMVGAWLLVLGAISLFGELAKKSDSALHEIDDRPAPADSVPVPRETVDGRAP